FCRLRKHSHVELVHWLHQILHAGDTDMRRIVGHFELDEDALEKCLIAALDRVAVGSGAVSDLSEQIDAAVEQGWMYGSIKFGAARIRSGHLLVGMLKTAALRNALYGVSTEFQK